MPRFIPGCFFLRYLYTAVDQKEKIQFIALNPGFSENIDKPN